MIPLITLEEHFFASSIGKHASYVEQLKWIPGLLDRLQDVSSVRLQEMDKGKISLQVVSHAPGLGCAPPSVSVQANNELFDAVGRNPVRFAGFAVLPMAEPEAAANELRRAVKELGFVGALVDNHVNGEHFDGERFSPFWKAAEELDVPIYLHPNWPSEAQKQQFEGNFDAGAALSMASSGFGWHTDCGLHILKLFAAGVFDDFPKLKIIIGHMGETLPFMLERIQQLSKRWGTRKKDFLTVWNENIWITTSGVWSLNPLACILRNTKIDHILYSVDYPFASNEDGLRWIQDLEQSGLVNEQQFEAICYRNAEKLLKIQAVQ